MAEQSKGNPENSQSEDDKQVLRVVMIGKSGSGKSTTGNTILGEESFKTDAGALSVTKNCQAVTKVRFGQKILLVDTPGVFDTGKPNSQVVREISKCISLCLPGPHVFLLVVQAGRFTPEEHDTVKCVTEIFGKEAFNHMILVFTKRDELEKWKQSFEEFLKKIPTTLDEIIVKCNKRCIAVDNSPDNKSRDTESIKLMEMINALIKYHGGKHYTNDMFEAAEKKVREREEEIRRRKDEEKQKEKDELRKELSKEFQNTFDSLKAEQNSLEQKIRDCTEEKIRLEKKLHDSDVKDEEMSEIKDLLRNVEKETRQYKEQAEDATHQRQLCVQKHDQRMMQQMRELDHNYEIKKDICVAKSRPEAVFTVVKGVAEAAWGLYNFHRLSE